MQTKINKEWVKNSRYIGKENFDYGIRLDVDFDRICDSIHSFKYCVLFNEVHSSTFGDYRTSFNSVSPVADESRYNNVIGAIAKVSTKFN